MLPRHRRAGGDDCGAGASAQTGRRLPVERTGDPAAVGYAITTLRVYRTGRCRSWDLSRTSIARAGTGRGDDKAPVRTPRRQPSSTGSCYGTSTYHVTESWIRSQGRNDRRPRREVLEVTHLNLNDGTVEGIKHREYPIFASNTIRRPRRVLMTLRDTFNNSYKLLTLNK